MKKIITLITIFILSNFILFKVLNSQLGNEIFVWYYFIPLILFSVFFSWWLASVFIMNKIIRFIFYISISYFIFHFFPQFFKFQYLVPVVILVIYYELHEVKNSIHKKGIILSNLKIIDTRETLTNVFVTFFKVSFDLAVFVRFQFDCFTQGKRLNKLQLTNILNSTNRIELINKIKEANKLDKRIFTLTYFFDNADLNIVFEIKGKREFNERDLKKL